MADFLRKANVLYTTCDTLIFRVYNLINVSTFLCVRNPVLNCLKFFINGALLSEKQIFIVKSVCQVVENK